MTRPVFFVVLLSASALACSSSTTGSGNASSSSSSSGGTTALAANCESRCEAKATECKAPDPAETCASICAKQPTESQATCLENSSCDTLASSAAPCGIGTSSSSSSSSSGSTSSSSGSTSSKTDPPGSPCGSANNGVNDCAPIGCKCHRRLFVLPRERVHQRLVRRQIRFLPRRLQGPRRLDRELRGVPKAGLEPARHY